MKTIKIEIEYDLTEEEVLDLLMFEQQKDGEKDKFLPSYEVREKLSDYELIRKRGYSPAAYEWVEYWITTYSGDALRKQLGLGVFE